MYANCKSNGTLSIRKSAISGTPLSIFVTSGAGPPLVFVVGTITTEAGSATILPTRIKAGPAPLAVQSSAPSGVPRRLLRRSPKKQQPLYLTRVLGYTIEGDFPARIREARILQEKLVSHVGHSAISVDVFHVTHAVDHVQV